MRYPDTRSYGSSGNGFDNSLAGLPGYEPSDRAVLAVAENCERSFVRLNRDLVYQAAVDNLAMREMLGIAITTAFAQQLTLSVPDAKERLDAIANEHGYIAADIMKGWRRNRHD